MRRIVYIEKIKHTSLLFLFYLYLRTQLYRVHPLWLLLVEYYEEARRRRSWKRFTVDFSFKDPEFKLATVWGRNRSVATSWSSSSSVIKMLWPRDRDKSRVNLLATPILDDGWEKSNPVPELHCCDEVLDKKKNKKNKKRTKKEQKEKHLEEKI